MAWRRECPLGVNEEVGVVLGVNEENDVVDCWKTWGCRPGDCCVPWAGKEGDNDIGGTAFCELDGKRAGENEGEGKYFACDIDVDCDIGSDEDVVVGGNANGGDNDGDDEGRNTAADEGANIGDADRANDIGEEDGDEEGGKAAESDGDGNDSSDDAVFADVLCIVIGVALAPKEAASAVAGSLGSK